MRAAPGRTMPPAYRFARAVLRPLVALITVRTWSGGENLPAAGGFIAVSNHVTNFDPLTFAHYLVDHDVPVKFLTKAELFRVPVVGPLIRATGQIIVHRGTARASESLREARAALERGECIGVYPEGTLTLDPAGWPMTGKTGAARLALETGAPVIPIAQWGAQRIIPRFFAAPVTVRPQPVAVTALPAVDLADLTGRPLTPELLREATERIMRDLTDGVARLRGEEPPARVWDRRRDGEPKAAIKAEIRQQLEQERAARRGPLRTWLAVRRKSA